MLKRFNLKFSFNNIKKHLRHNFSYIGLKRYNNYFYINSKKMETNVVDKKNAKTDKKEKTKEKNDKVEKKEVEVKPLSNKVSV